MFYLVQSQFCFSFVVFHALTQRPSSEPLGAPKTPQGPINPPTKWFECHDLLNGSVSKHLKGCTARKAPWRAAPGHTDCSLTEPSHLLKEKKGVWSAPFCPQNMQAAVTAWLMSRAIPTSAPGVGVSSLLHPWVVEVPPQLDLHLPVIITAQVSPFLKRKQCCCWWSHSDVNVWNYPRGPMLLQRCIMLNHRPWVHMFTLCRHNRLLSRWHFSFLMNPLMLPNDTLVNVVSHHLEILIRRWNTPRAAVFFGAIYQSLSNRSTLYLLSYLLLLGDGHNQEQFNALNDLVSCEGICTYSSFFSPFDKM